MNIVVLVVLILALAGILVAAGFVILAAVSNRSRD
jgi:hypothetical protein